PAGDRWDGVPARPADRAPDVPALTVPAAELDPVWHGALMLGARLTSLVVTPTALVLALLWIGHLRGLSSADLIAWVGAPVWRPEIWWVVLAAATVGVPVAVIAQAAA